MTNHAKNFGFGERVESPHMFIPGHELSYGTTPPAQALNTPWEVYQYTIGDDSVITRYIPNAWFESEAIACYIIWACNETYAANTGEVQWQLDYETLAEGEVFGNGTTGALTSGDVDLPTNARERETTDIGDIPGADLANADIIGLAVSRIAIAGGNDPVVEPEIAGILLTTADKFPAYQR